MGVQGVLNTVLVVAVIHFLDHDGTLLVIVFLFVSWLLVQRWILEPHEPGGLEVSA